MGRSYLTLCLLLALAFLRRFLVGRWKDHHLTRDVPILVRTGEVGSGTSSTDHVKFTASFCLGWLHQHGTNSVMRAFRYASAA